MLRLFARRNPDAERISAVKQLPPELPFFQKQSVNIPRHRIVRTPAVYTTTAFYGVFIKPGKMLD